MDTAQLHRVGHDQLAAETKRETMQEAHERPLCSHPEVLRGDCIYVEDN